MLLFNKSFPDTTPDHEVNEEGKANDRNKILRDAMKAADRTDGSTVIPIPQKQSAESLSEGSVEPEQFDALATELEQNLNSNESLARDEDNAEVAPETRHETGTIVESDPQEEGPRAREAKRRHQTILEISKLANDGLQALGEIADEATQLSGYFARLETDISQLEDIEGQYAHLKEMSLRLAKQSTELKSTLRKQHKEIEVLESLKTRMRSMIGQAKEELVQHISEKENLATKLSTRDAELTRLRDDRATLQEANTVAQSRTLKILAELQFTKEELAKVKSQDQQHEQEITKLGQRISAIAEERDLYLGEIRELRQKEARSDEKIVEISAKLEQAEFLLESERTEYGDNLNRLKIRIAELEKEPSVPAKS